MSSNSVARAESVILAPDDTYPFCITAKRYTLPVFEDREEALTLIFLHSTGFFKEIWEPTLEELLKCVASQRPAIIREVWAIECPNHGQSAVLNEATLQLPENQNRFSCKNYALAVKRFLLAAPSKGAKVDFKRRNLVGIGHSLGAVAITILQHLEPRLPFRSIIIVEPLLSPGGWKYLEQLCFKLVRGAYERRDVWPNKEKARRALKDGVVTRKWDPRILNVFVEYGLRTHPGAKFVNAPYWGMTLCCTREEEAAMYRDVDGATESVACLNEACSRLPVHIILGAENDHIPQEVHNAIIDPLSPRQFASISRVENVGHLVPQCAPAALAEIIHRILVKGADPPTKIGGQITTLAKL
ncbi:uncharacterized protein FOMMEDRAFT_157868 [Fomitiporia mediterranea MF3/22]|uniref:uncharacterized protein n=1 Tax=Fomitiporia mediterranea (strain MF3/22) TaxID=694068 RepID=UPI0004407734|nr:uncharacterized protein FOMMEDRAFT_157868 [Fomitiporia mediterranea MF3/22]EJD00762.1 hypothetical protein FOMMEDRAFT_157868 [Fomitiporia mediterranea MF3/22]